MTDLSIPETQAAPSRRALALIAGGLAVWAAVIVTLAAGGTFDVPPDRPMIPIVLAVTLPVLGFAAAVAAIPALKRFVLGLDPVLITSLQAWRILGGLFLAVHAFDVLPGFFAWPAGIGDVAVGLAAPFVAWRLVADRAFAGTAGFRWFHYLGLLDFVVAVGTGIAARNAIPGFVDQITTAPMGELPLVMIPAFAVPAFIVLHLIALMQNWHAR